jgi:hypothetical protein
MSFSTVIQQQQQQQQHPSYYVHYGPSTQNSMPVLPERRQPQAACSIPARRPVPVAADPVPSAAPTSSPTPTPNNLSSPSATGEDRMTERASFTARIAALEEEATRMRASLQETDDLLSQKKEQCAQLSSKIMQLESQVAEQNATAEKTTQNWQKQESQLRSTIAGLELKLQTMTDANKKLLEEQNMAPAFDQLELGWKISQQLLQNHHGQESVAASSSKNLFRNNREKQSVLESESDRAPASEPLEMDELLDRLTHHIVEKDYLLETHNKLLKREVQRETDEKEQLRADFKTLQNELRRKSTEFKELRLFWSLRQVLRHRLTPRLILSLLRGDVFPRVRQDQGLAQARFFQTFNIKELEVEFLDIPLQEEEQVATFWSSVATEPGSCIYKVLPGFFSCPHCNVLRIAYIHFWTGQLATGISPIDESASRLRRNIGLHTNILFVCLMRFVRQNWWLEDNEDVELERDDYKRHAIFTPKMLFSMLFNSEETESEPWNLL